MTFFAAIFVFLFLPRVTTVVAKNNSSDWREKTNLLRKKIIWLQATIVAASYACYKGLDHFSLYLHEVHHYNEHEAASIVAKIAYLRVLGAIIGGLLSNKFKPSIVLNYGFILISLIFFFIGLLSKT